ncbi:MAG: type II CAAX endopeptidase family protein [Candidatus Acidiferrum sp.]
MAKESGSTSMEVPPPEPPPSNRTGVDADQPRPTSDWARTGRKNLLIWVAIGFLLPGVIAYLFFPILRHKVSVLTIQDELPIKAIMASFMILATWVVSRREHRPLDDYGLPLRQAFGSRFWEGALWGFAMLSLVLLPIWATGHFHVDSAALTGAAVFRYALGWALVFLAVSIGEELSFRGYWLFLMSRRVGFWRSALFLSIIFGVAHLGNNGENILGILQVFAVGMLFCFTIRRTGTLWFALGFHAAWDWAETFFYGTPDSGLLGVGRLLNTSVQGPAWLTGGSAGPEGSILVFLVLLFCALLIHFRFPNVIYPDRPL